jgi:hypothetical protein
MMKKLTVAVAAAALAVVPLTASADDATLQVLSTAVDVGEREDAQVTVVHGVPGADGVNILADDGVLLEDVDFTDIATTNVPAGTYAIAVSTSETEDDAVIGPIDLTFEAGGIYAVVAHLDEGGAPTASFFPVNNAEGVSAFHTAAFPPVAIVAGGEIAADDLANGEAAQIDAPAGTVLEGVGIAAAGSTDIALPVGDLTVPEGQRLLAFAVGAPADDAAEDDSDAGTDDDADDAEERPTAVHSGTGGLAADGMPLWVVGLMALGALGVTAPAIATARKRS